MLLKHLGYELSDLDLWDGWLLLEESSAERIIRDYLIRWFAPRLSRVRTLAANGTGDIDRTFDALYKLVLFTHLEEHYRDRVLVLLDGDGSGLEAVDRLRNKFAKWPENGFICFSERDFEYYYPERFRSSVLAALAIGSKGGRRTAKRDLLIEVLTWIDENEELARSEFEQSAAEVITLLQTFARSLGPASILAR